MSHPQASNLRSSRLRRRASDLLLVQLPMDGPFLTVREAAGHLKLSKSLLDKLRLTGEGPAYMKLGQRRVVYAVEDLDAWAEKGRRESTTSQQEVV